MARYIDISDLHVPEGIFTGVNVPKLLAWIHSITPADVVKAKHGTWEMLPLPKKFESGEYVKFRCSECETVFISTSLYCPKCGARMDGKEKENG